MFAQTHTSRLGSPRLRSALRPWRWIDAAFATYRHRDRLGRLDAHMLDDIGLSARDAHTEASRPFWDVPDWWR